MTRDGKLQVKDIKTFMLAHMVVVQQNEKAIFQIALKPVPSQGRYQVGRISAGGTEWKTFWKITDAVNHYNQ
jgi:hypothetical protein